jgi:glycosyltransferase involved in cell wall biosynthesis
VSQLKSYELIAAADVLAIPSYCEGIPKVAVEAAALGTPFVLTSTCGLAPQIRGSTIGTVVSHWDPSAFADALIAAVSTRPDPEHARALVHRFSSRAVAIALDELLGAIS